MPVCFPTAPTLCPFPLASLLSSSRSLSPGFLSLPLGESVSWRGHSCWWASGRSSGMLRLCPWVSSPVATVLYLCACRLSARSSRLRGVPSYLLGPLLAFLQSPHTSCGLIAVSLLGPASGFLGNSPLSGGLYLGTCRGFLLVCLAVFIVLFYGAIWEDKKSYPAVPP